MTDLSAIQELIDCSTLGAPGARALAGRAAEHHVDYVLWLASLADGANTTNVGRLPSVTGRKVLVAGGFGVGKTTLIHSVSNVVPVTTEAILTSAGAGVDDKRQVSRKTSTTVCLDYGRTTVGGDLSLHLFGSPGQTRFWFMWDDLLRDAEGAVVMVDTRRIADCFAAIDFFERRRVPYLVAINCFDGHQYHSVQDVRVALAIPASVPIVACDARSRASGKKVFESLIDHLGIARSSPLAASSTAVAVSGSAER